jgi:RNA 2',3'-cyclic 3'-phosphodiesterase
LGSGVRAFVAVEVPRADGGNVAAITPVSDHLTLHFLGEVDSETAERVIRALAPAVAHRAPFEFVLDGVGAFPSADRPRVVWRGVSRGVEALRTLADAVRTAATSEGGASDSAPFVPHLTLFRVRSLRDRERAARVLAPGASLPPATAVSVTRVQFVESVRSPSGVRHHPRAEFPLLGTPP